MLLGDYEWDFERALRFDQHVKEAPAYGPMNSVAVWIAIVMRIRA